MRHYYYSDTRKHEKEYYDDDMKGLPVRRRRNVEPNKNILPIILFNTAINNLKGPYNMESVQTERDTVPIVTAKSQVIAALRRISDSLPFMDDVK